MSSLVFVISLYFPVSQKDSPCKCRSSSFQAAGAHAAGLLAYCYPPSPSYPCVNRIYSSPCPGLLPLYIAWSAELNRLSKSPPSSGANATPILRRCQLPCFFPSSLICPFNTSSLCLTVSSVFHLFEEYQKFVSSYPPPQYHPNGRTDEGSFPHSGEYHLLSNVRNSHSPF